MASWRTEDYPMFMFPLAALAVKQLADFIGKLVALGSHRAPQGASLQSVDGLVQPVSHLSAEAGDTFSRSHWACSRIFALALAASSIR